VSQENVTELGRYLARVLIVFGATVVVGAPLVKRRFDRHLSSLHARDSGDAMKS